MLAACSCARTTPLPSAPVREHTRMLARSHLGACMHSDPSCTHTRGVGLPLLWAVPGRVGMAAHTQGAPHPLYTPVRHPSTCCLACTPKHSMTWRHPPAPAPFRQHLHVPGCAHVCLHTYLCIHTHTCKHIRACTFIYVHSHVLTCIRVCTHKRAYKHVHPPMHAGIHTCACTHVLTETLVHRHASTGTHVRMHQHAGTHKRTPVCAHVRTHTHTHVSVHAHVLRHVDTRARRCGCAHVCAYTVCTQACAHARAHPRARARPSGAHRQGAAETI